MKTKRKYGLALGGGAVLGGVHIGVLKAIEESDIELTHITGTSVGAIIGALFVFGKSSEEIADIMLDINWSDIADLSISKYYKKRQCQRSHHGKQLHTGHIYPYRER